MGESPRNKASKSRFSNSLSGNRRNICCILSSSDVQAKWHQDTGYLPITIAAGEATRASGFYAANPGTDVAVIQMTTNQPTANSKGLRLGSFDQIRGIIDEELEGIWSGDKTAQEAMDSAKQRGDALLRRFETANNR